MEDSVNSEQMFLPQYKAPWTLEKAKERIKSFYETTGRRPLVRELRPLDNWLCDQGTSLNELCDEMGFPKGYRLHRTMESVRREVLEFFKEKGRRPTVKESNSMMALDTWLRTRGSSLNRLCDDLDIPSSYQYFRTMESATQEVFSFYKKHGRRPVKHYSKEMSALDAWLRKNGSSLRKLCDTLKLPQKYNLNRSMEKARKWVLDYYRTHGKRPTRRVSKETNALDRWLYRHGSSLALLCKEVGIPGGKDTTKFGVEEKRPATFKPLRCESFLP